jgi:hypothetical protein
MKYRNVFGCILLMVILVLPAMGQQRGQYLPGFGGLNSGLQAPPGLTYANYFFWYPSSTFKGQDGNKAPINFDLNLLVDFNLLAYSTKAKFLGAHYGMTLGVPVLNTAVDLSNLGLGKSSWGVGDIYVEPVNLGWKLKRADIKVAYGFVAPTGKYNSDGTGTTTTDFWGHEVTFATTAYLDKSKLTQVSFNTNWEFHQTKRHSDVKAGDNMTLECGIGKIFVKNQGKQLIQVGGVGYAEFQLMEDSGADVSSLTRHNKDRVFAVGPEFGVIFPPHKLNFMVRVLPEFGARNRTQGITLVFAAGKSF